MKLVWCWVDEVRSWWCLSLEGNRMEEHLAFLASLCLCVKVVLGHLYHGDKSVR